eukprot:1812522-Prymnesium_polylepis.3
MHVRCLAWTVVGGTEGDRVLGAPLCQEATCAPTDCTGLGRIDVMKQAPKAIHGTAHCHEPCVDIDAAPATHARVLFHLAAFAPDHRRFFYRPLTWSR